MLRQRLSGDAIQFESQGKIKARQLWNDYSFEMFKQKGSPLDFIWLANNDLTDIQFIYTFGKNIIIPDHSAINRSAKQRTLNLLDYENVKIVDSIAAGVKSVPKADIINLDFCSHFDTTTLAVIDSVLKDTNAEKQLLFAVFSKSGIKSLSHNKFPEHRRLAGTIPEIDWWMSKLFKTNDIQSKPLPNFPFEYTVVGRKANKMFSFGWEITR